MTDAVIAQKEPYSVDVVAGKEYYWCACGRSSRQPFCDGSHKVTGFSPSALEATGVIASGRGSVRSSLRLAIGQIDDLTRFLTIAVGDPAAGDHRQLVVSQIPSALRPSNGSLAMTLTGLPNARSSSALAAVTRADSD